MRRPPPALQRICCLFEPVTLAPPRFRPASCSPVRVKHLQIRPVTCVCQLAKRGRALKTRAEPGCQGVRRGSTKYRRGEQQRQKGERGVERQGAVLYKGRGSGGWGGAEGGAGEGGGEGGTRGGGSQLVWASYSFGAGLRNVVAEGSWRARWQRSKPPLAMRVAHAKGKGAGSKINSEERERVRG